MGGFFLLALVKGNNGMRRILQVSLAWIGEVSAGTLSRLLQWKRPIQFKLTKINCGKMVGATGFEPVTTRTPSVCATRLRYAPTTVEVREM